MKNRVLGLILMCVSLIQAADITFLQKYACWDLQDVESKAFVYSRTKQTFDDNIIGVVLQDQISGLIMRVSENTSATYVQKVTDILHFMQAVKPIKAADVALQQLYFAYAHELLIYITEVFSKEAKKQVEIQLATLLSAQRKKELKLHFNQQVHKIAQLLSENKELFVSDLTGVKTMTTVEFNHIISPKDGLLFEA